MLSLALGTSAPATGTGPTVTQKRWSWRTRASHFNNSAKSCQAATTLADQKATAMEANPTTMLLQFPALVAAHWKTLPVELNASAFCKAVLMISYH